MQGWHSCEKSLNFCASPWKVLEFFSTLNIVAWKVFLNTFCKSQLREGNGDLHKFFFFFYAIFNYQFKTSELKNAEKLVEQTVQAL